MTQPAVFRLLNYDVALRIPRPSDALALAIADGAIRSAAEPEMSAQVRMLHCAALAACWPDTQPSPWGKVSGALLDRGALVLDALIGAGLGYAEVFEVALAAFDLTCASLPTAARVAEAARPSVASAT
jgi:hypothetical protein